MRVVLAYVTPISWAPMGIGMVAAVLEEEGIEVFPVINNFENYQDVDELAKNIIDLEPDLVGISFLTYGVKNNYSMARILKKENILLVAGGNHPTLFPEECINNGFDFTIIGEGEYTCKELIKHLRNPGMYPLSNIRGISFRNHDGKIVNNGISPIIEDLNSLPFPARHCFNKDDFLMPDGDLKGYGAILSSRGCPHKCTFCSTEAVGSRFRKRSAKNTVDEIELVNKEFGVNTFNFLDDTFSVDRVRVKDVCNEIIKRGLDIKWNCGCRVTDVQPEILELQKKSGCFMMNFGIESGDPETLLKIKKGITIESALMAVKMTKEAGIKVYANFMTGFPWETPTQINNTTSMVHRIHPWADQLSAGNVLVPIPGSKIYDDLKSTYDIENYWLRDDFNDIGMGVWKNVVNPYKISNWFQRNMYDDTLVRNDTFFKYSRGQKKAIYRLMRTIGTYNIKKEYGKSWRTILYLLLGYTSFYLAEIIPSLEIFIVSKFKKSGTNIHRKFGLGYKKRK